MKVKINNVLPLICLLLTLLVVIVAACLSYPPLKQKSFSATYEAVFVSHMWNEDKVNVNTAPLEELMVLKGIGEVKARAIIDMRNEKGPFENAENLLKVKGIGEKTLEDIRPFICFD